MAKTHFIKFRVSKDEKERIINNSRMNGYHKVSDYLRNLALNINLIAEIYTILKNGNKTKNT